MEINHTREKHRLIGPNLKSSGETLTALFRTIPIPTFVWQKKDQDFILVDYNDAAADITHKKIVQLLGAKVEDLSPDNPEVKLELSKCFEQKTALAVERLYQLKTTGETKHFSAKYDFVPPDLVLIYSEDITPRKETEKKLKDSEKRYQELANLLPQTIYETDAAYNITYSNQIGFEIFGYDSNDLNKSLNIFDLIIPQEREKVLQNAKKIMAGDNPGGNEYTALRKDGSKFPVNIYSSPIIRDGKVIGLRGVLIDISKLKNAQIALKKAHDELEQRVLQRTAMLEETNIILEKEIVQRKRAEEHLKQNQERYRAVIEQSVDCIFLVDLKTKTITEANSTFQKLLGYSGDEIVNLQLYDFVAHQRAQVDQKIKTICQGQHFIGERKYRRKDGGLVDVEVRASLISYCGKKVMCVVSRDVSRRKRHEKIQMVIHQIANSINTTKDLGELFQAIKSILSILIDTSMFYIAIYYEQNDSIIYPFCMNENKSLAEVSFDKIFIKKVIKQGKSLIHQENSDIMVPAEKSGLRKTQPKLQLGVPLKIGNKNIGAIAVQLYSSSFRDASKELEILELVSNQIALAIEKRMAEDNLKSVHQIYREAIENAQGVPYRLNYSTNRYEILGKQAEELIGIDFNKISLDEIKKLQKKIIVIDKDFNITPKEYSQAFRQGKIKKFSTDFMIMLPSGQEKWLSDCAVPIRDKKSQEVVGSLGILQDITVRKREEEELKKYRTKLEQLVKERTDALRIANKKLNLELAERKRTELALQENKKRYELLYEENPSMYCTIDLKGKILSINKFGASQLGYLVEELIGKSMLSVIYEEDKKIFQEELKKISTNEKLTHNWKYRNVRNDGEIIWVKVSARLIEDNNGQKLILIVCEDITDKIKTQDEKEKLLKRLADEEKLATLGQFMAAISHEINNPLDIIITAIDSLTDEYSYLPGLLDHTTKIRQQVSRVNRLAKDILTYIKPQTLRFESVDINKILADTIELTQRYSQNNAKIETKFNMNLPLIEGDPIGLGIVFKNIILNAIESLKQDGKINILTQYLKNERLRVTIKDNGEGIEKSRLKSIFEQFHTSKRDIGGAGLGLAISSEIVKKHAGTIRVRSKLGEGTTFTINLPVRNSE